MSSPWTSSVLRSQRVGGQAPRARGGLARQLLLVFLPLILIPLGVFAYLIYNQVRADLIRQATAQLTSLATLKVAQIEAWADSRVDDVNTLARTAENAADVEQYLAGRLGPEPIVRRFQTFLNSNPNYEAVMLAGPADGVVRLSTLTLQYDRFIGQTFLQPPDLARARQNAVLFAPAFDQRMNDVQVLVAAPVFGAGGQAIALVYGFVRDEQLLDIVAPSPGLGSTGRAYVVTHDGYQLGSFVTAPGTLPNSLGVERARGQQQNGSAIYPDPNGVEVLGAFRWLPAYQLALLVEESTADAFAPLNRFGSVLAAIAFGAIAISALGVVFFTRRITRPLQAFTEAALRMAGGDLAAAVKVDRQDEIGLLAQAFNSMGTELRGLYQDLEAKVADRTRQLAAAAEIGRSATSILNTDDLLRQAVALIGDRFDYYHVSVFLLDESGAFAGLREATGRVGAQLKASGYRLPVGSNSLVGWVTANGRARIALDVAGDAVYFQNELLPETRSEAALPLRVGDRLIGALDVQSRSLNAFNQADIEVLQILSDQLAIAIENGRLFARQERVAQLEQRVAGLTARIHSALSPQTILDRTASELGQVFGARKVVVRLAPEAEALLGSGPADALPASAQRNGDPAAASSYPGSSGGPIGV
ncbi:MAG: GAF domain-containing protein [Anaerolineales bacterium]|nr:GAF domain-containing protein [Anaerolineales bacterium]